MPQVKELNALEVCLMIDTAMRHGNDGQKRRAKALAERMSEDDGLIELNTNQRNRMFDAVIGLNSLEGKGQSQNNVVS